MNTLLVEAISDDGKKAESHCIPAWRILDIQEVAPRSGRPTVVIIVAGADRADRQYIFAAGTPDDYARRLGRLSEPRLVIDERWHPDKV